MADVVTDYRIKTAAVLGLDIYAALPDKAEAMRAADIPVAGTLDDLLRKVDVVADCTQKIGAANKILYERLGVKAIYQGRITCADWAFLRGPGQL